MTESILDTIKEMLGIPAGEASFDQILISEINAAFSTLTQLGVGPLIGFQIQNKDNKWVEFYTDPRLNGVQNYVYLRVRVVFDPPTSGFTQTAMERQIQELEFRLNITAEYG